MQYTNEQQAVLEKAIQNYLTKNKELVLRRLLATDGLDISASSNKDINLNTSGTGKAYYNGIELGTGGGGGGGGGGSAIVGSGCSGSVTQPTVECSPDGAPCEVHITVGKGGKLRIRESE